MVNTPYLVALLDEKNVSKVRLARELHISRTALYKKINGEIPFKEHEATKICKIAKVTTMKEREKIFPE